MGYFLYQEVFSPDSVTSHYSDAVEEVRASPRARELLGPGNQIIAFGEPTHSRWSRRMPIAYVIFLCLAGLMFRISLLDRSSLRRDRNGRDHLLMHFNVSVYSHRRAVNSSNRHRSRAQRALELLMSIWSDRLLTLNINTRPSA